MLGDRKRLWLGPRFRFPHPVIGHEIGVDLQAGEISVHHIRGALQFRHVVFRFHFPVSTEVCQPPVRRTVGMAHENDPFAGVQANRKADLFQDEIALEIIAGRSQSLGATGNYDHVRPRDRILLEEFTDRQIDAVIKAAENGSVGDVRVRRGVEMEDFTHRETIYHGDTESRRN